MKLPQQPVAVDDPIDVALANAEGLFRTVRMSQDNFADPVAGSVHW